MEWFPFQGIMLHTENNMKVPDEHLYSLLKLLSISKSLFINRS